MSSWNSQEGWTESRAITEASFEALKAFGRLHSVLAGTSCKTSELSHQDIADEAGRFRMWAANMGALQMPSSAASLDSRLHDAPQVRQQVERILKRLLQAIERASSIASGASINRTSSSELEVLQRSDYDSDDDNDELSSVSSDESSLLHHSPPTSEIVELQRAIHDTITNLFKLSIVIRKPTPRGRYAASKDTQPFDVSFDVAHVDREWLIERLGKANTRRREYFRYRREHRRRLATEASQNKKETKTGSNSKVVQQHTDLRSDLKDGEWPYQAHTVTHTKATTFIDTPRIYELPPIEEDSVSLTSYATTTVGDSLHALRVPDPSYLLGGSMNFEYGEPFECPYCYTFQIVKNVRDWRRHVFRDLEPYICTFEGCSSQPFAERHAWFEHELQTHRKKWHCSLCRYPPFDTAQMLEKHMRSDHPGRFTEAQLSSILQACEVTDDKFAASACPLCRDWKLLPATENAEARTVFATTTQFRRHLAKHLEQIALFALPKIECSDLHESDEASKDAVAGQSSIESSNAEPELPEPSNQLPIEYTDEEALTSTMATEDSSAERDPSEWTFITAERFIEPDSEVASLQERQKTLRDEIELKMVHRQNPDIQFLPNGSLKHIFDTEKVTRRLKELNGFTTDLEALQSYICNEATRLFAILVWMGREPLIEQFFQHQFKDEQLPVGLVINDDHPLNNYQWTHKKDLEDFCNHYQWLFLSPIFDENQFRYHFHERMRMPFVTEQPTSQKEAQFTVVEEWLIHRDHICAHEFIRKPSNRSEHPIVAVKALKRMARDEIQFEALIKTEVHYLEHLRDLRHPHLLNAIAYYTRGRLHYFLFPWATRGNLLDLWNQAPPRLDREFLQWVFVQLCGLAEAIKTRHITTNTRHGNIKPENILCLDDSSKEPSTEVNSCKLVLADTGLERHDGELPDLRIAANRGTIQYEPPEEGLGLFMSQISGWYDVWSLGCILLEFIIWILYGSEDLSRFREELSSLGERRFYVIVEAPKWLDRTARLNNVVRRWIDWIKHDGRCAPPTALRSLLDLVIERLLFVDIGSRHSCRANSAEMDNELKAILDQATSTTSGRLEWINWNAPAQDGPKPREHLQVTSDAAEAPHQQVR